MAEEEQDISSKATNEGTGGEKKIGLSPREAIKRMEEKGSIRGGQDEPPGVEGRVEAWREGMGILGGLLVPPEEGGEAPLNDPKIVRIARAALLPHNQNRKGLEGLLDRVNDLFINDEDLDPLQAAQLGGVIRGLADILPPAETLFREYEYDTQVGAELDMRAVQPPFDTSWPPKYFTSLKEARRHGLQELGDWQRLLRARAQLANACALKNEKKDTDLVATKDNPLFNLKMQELRLMYEMPGVKETLWLLFDELFEGEYDDDKGRLVLKLKPVEPPEGEDPGAGAVKKLKDVEALKEKYWRERIRDGDEMIINPDSLIARGFVGDEVDAKAAVAVAWNLMFIGNTVESADIDRKVKPNPSYGEQPRALCHPLSKALVRYLPETKDKFDPDKIRPFGGQRFGNWLKERVTKDPKFRAGLKSGKIKPFPETMCVSLFEYIFVEQLMEEADGEMVPKRKVTLAEKLLNKTDEGIDWNMVSQETAGDYKDFMGAATNGYTFVVGLDMFDFKDPRTWDEWTTKLGDVIGKMRPKILGTEYDSDDFLVWSICASIGLRFGTSELFLNIPDEAPYGTVLDTILDPILVDQKRKKQRIKARFLEKNVFSGPARSVREFLRS